jgi:hypothetical protein
MRRLLIVAAAAGGVALFAIAVHGLLTALAKGNGEMAQTARGACAACHRP